jgi:hypothetical protein
MSERIDLQIFLQDQAHLIKLARLLVARLERLSADSIWAHRASGARGELLRWLEYCDAGLVEQNGDEEQPHTHTPLNEDEIARFEHILSQGYYMLENAAKELLE